MHTISRIDIHEAKDMIDAGQASIVDIRDAASFQEAHIEGAVLLNDENVNDFIEKVDKNKPLICYCYHGHSSQSAAQYFHLNGFAKVYSIDGGLEEWRSAYPVRSNTN